MTYKDIQNRLKQMTPQQLEQEAFLFLSDEDRTVNITHLDVVTPEDVVEDVLEVGDLVFGDRGEKS